MTPTSEQQIIINATYQSLQTYGVALNCSETGTGKSLMGSITAAMTGRDIYWITPKVAVRQMWDHAERSGIPLADVRNIEWLRYSDRPGWIIRRGKQYVLDLDPEKSILVIDEAHCVTGDNSLNANILRATRQLVKRGGIVNRYEVPVLLMSATMFESPLKLRNAVGERLRLFEQEPVSNWLRRHGVSLRQVKTNYGVRTFYEFNPKPDERRIMLLKALNKSLFPKFGGRLLRTDMPGFPESKIVTHLVDLKPQDLKRLESHYEDLKLKAASATDVLAERTYCKQMSELLKIHAFADMAENLVAEGNNVIIFIYYDATQQGIEDELKSKKLPYVVIDGKQSKANRIEAIEKFQSNSVNICICKISAGGVGVELGDMHGRARVTIMSPPDSVGLFKQALGRPWRYNSLSSTIQYVIVATTPTELKIKKSLDMKCENMDLIQDSDLLGV